MTIVIALKVGDGLVLSADSATTLEGTNGYLNTYFNAEKLFHLEKRIPIGVLTFGLGGLDGRSVSAHIKDLRLRMADVADKDYGADPTTLTVEHAAKMIRQYFYEERYTKTFPANAPSPTMGFFVGGYRAAGDSPEVWEVVIENGNCASPKEIISTAENGNAVWQGLTEACSRLLLGYSPEILNRLIQAGLPAAAANQLLQAADSLLDPAMPIQDAIDLADYLVEVSCGYVRFAPGTPAVAKPIDTAVITKHEGFRWVHRKHFYPRELNLDHPKLEA